MWFLLFGQDSRRGQPIGHPYQVCRATPSLSQSSSSRTQYGGRKGTVCPNHCPQRSPASIWAEPVCIPMTLLQRRSVDLERFAYSLSFWFVMLTFTVVLVDDTAPSSFFNFLVHLLDMKFASGYRWDLRDLLPGTSTAPRLFFSIFMLKTSDCNLVRRLRRGLAGFWACTSRL